jgi:predicted Mrr-cat superfamily restriction endonuclease
MSAARHGGTSESGTDPAELSLMAELNAAPWRSGRAWLVRAGREGKRRDVEARRDGVVGIGFKNVGPLIGITDKDELRRRMAAARPDKSPATRSKYVNEIWQFLYEMGADDLVAMPMPTCKMVAIGLVTGLPHPRAEYGESIITARTVDWWFDIPYGDLDGSMAVLKNYRGTVKSLDSSEVAYLRRLSCRSWAADG